ncbi:hypothetical protein [Azospirillum canadense]|uniref:hypothetical protein n=1 Tax=Azospirillum canadense TaxID=403962 RepID=UPI00222637FE|nr:hypothetical protein [Azospirillum canadense]MCW2242304.1 hypothetical protein [Azospirillum canadense]
MSQDTLAKVGALIASQNNRCTHEPLFVVFQKRRIYGLDEDHTDNIVWLDTDGDYATADERQHRILERMHERGRDTGRWERVGYVDTDEFVTACFTEVGAQAYIDANGHNLHQPFIFVTSLYRNDEMIALRHLMLNAAPKPAEAA